jgi:hypothetical protein
MRLPWNKDDSLSMDDRSTEETVYQELLKRDYDIFKLRKEPITDPDFLDVSKRLLAGLEKRPWICVISNSTELLDRLGNVFPVIFALNNLGKSVITVTGDELIDILAENQTERDISLKTLSQHHLLYIHRFLAKGKLLRSFEMGLDSLLSARSGKKLIIDIHCNVKTADSAIKQSLTYIEDTAGKHIASSLSQDMATLHKYVEKEGGWFTKL